MSRATFPSLVLLSTLAIPGLAQFPGYEKVLLPIAPKAPIQGAFGSVFVMELSTLNNSTAPVLMFPWGPDCQTLCPPDFDVRPLPPMKTISPEVSRFVSSHVEGYFLYVEAARAADVSFGLRVRDISRDDTSWGTAIPVITLKDTSVSTISLHDIPSDSRFRRALRVYDFDATGSGQVNIDVFAIGSGSEPDAPVASLLAPLTYEPGAAAAYPGYFYVDLATIPGIPNDRRLRIDITPKDSAFRTWACVSVTNNDTQHITLISPTVF